MKGHNLETNHAFMKSLKSNSALGQKQFNFIAISPKEVEETYRAIQFKKSAAEFQIGHVRSHKIKLTEYKRGKALETLKLKI
jgi:hypothetical protein